MAWNSTVVSKSITISDLVPGESAVVTVKFGNNSTGGGVETFRPQDAHLDWHYIDGVDSFTKSCGGISQKFSDYVSPYGYGDKYQIHEYTFNIPIVAPNKPGNHTLQYRLVIVHDGDGSHEAFGAIATISIIIRQPANAQLISNTFPSQMEVAERGTAFITFKNTGAWAWDYNFRIEAKTPDTSFFSKSWFYIPLGVSVPPGSSHTFQIPLRANCAGGTYNPQYRLFWNRIQRNFGDTASKTVTVIPVTKPMQNLNDYNWKCLTERRSTADISWSYDIDISGTDIPQMFQKLQHEENGVLAMLGYPAEYEISTDVPETRSNVGAFSAGYFLSNLIPIKSINGHYIRQSRAGSDIKNWQKTDSNISAIQTRTEEIKTFENPSHYLARILFYVDDTTGNIDSSKPGPYGLWGTNTGTSQTIRPVPNWGISKYTGSDGNQYADGDTIPSGVTISANAKWDNRHPTTEEPYMIEKKQFAYDGKKIIDILDELAEHCHMLYFTRFVKVGTEWREYLYWIPKYGVALGWLGVSQTPLMISPNTSSLVGSPGIGASIVLEDNFNCVWVEACRKKDSAWFYAFKGGAGVIQGTEIARPLYYRSHDLLPDPAGNVFRDSAGNVATLTPSSNFGPGGLNYGTPAENARCNQIVAKKADQLVNLLEYEVPTFTATFRDIELDLYRVLYFTGFDGLKQFNNIEMQVISVEKTFNPPDSGGYQIAVTCAPKAMLQASGKFQSVIDEIQDNYDKLIQGIESSNVDDKLSLIISTYDEGSMCNAQLRSTGSMIKTRTYGYRTENG